MQLLFRLNSPSYNDFLLENPMLQDYSLFYFVFRAKKAILLSKSERRLRFFKKVN